MRAVKNSVVMSGGAFLMRVAGGVSWSTEFPDAELFNEQSAMQQARLFQGRAVADRGLASERVLASFEVKS